MNGPAARPSHELTCLTLVDIDPEEPTLRNALGRLTFAAPRERRSHRFGFGRSSRAVDRPCGRQRVRQACLLPERPSRELSNKSCATPGSKRNDLVNVTTCR